MPGYANMEKENSPSVDSYEKVIYVDEFPTCFLCCEQAVLRTETEPYIDICSIINHPDYTGVEMVNLKKK